MLYVRKNPRPGTFADVREVTPTSAPQQPDEELMAEADYEAWLATARAALPLRQETDVVLQRLTEAERTALFTARTQSPGIDYFVTRATAAGAIRDDDPEFPTARDALAQAGIIAAARWSALLAP